MSKTLLKYILIIIILLVNSCSEKITGVKEGNLPPDTFLTLYPDSGSSISQQKSQLRVHWWGDDPDGFVVGFLLTWDGKNWSFTKSNDSTFALKITGLDTNYLFQVSAVDNSGNGKYDDAIVVNGVNFGAEPFFDLNGNKKWDVGEEYIDLGLIDPTPAKLNFPIKNSIPVVSFLQNSSVPETTFTVASFSWSISDIDGDETIDKVLVSLNDSLNFVELPGNTRFITIRAKAPFASDVVDADIFLGSSVNTPYVVKLPNLKLNSKNIFYLKARDIAGSYSETIQMPDTNKIWYVKKQKGNILIVDDYAVSDNASSFYNLVIDSLNNGSLKNKYDILDIKYGKTATTPGVFLPKFINPTFTETMKLFKCVFWYTDNEPSLEVAQLTLGNYVNSGGKVLLSMIFPQIFDTRGLSDFLPIDSVSPFPINIVPRNTLVNLTSDGASLGYPPLSIDDSTIPVARIRWFYPSSASAVNLYTLGTTTPSNPIVGFKDRENKRIFIGLPLHRCNGGQSNVKEFFRKVLFDEFGVGQ